MKQKYYPNPFIKLTPLQWSCIIKADGMPVMDPSKMSQTQRYRASRGARKSRKDETVVVVYDNNDQKIGIYDTISAAQADLGVAYGTIAAALHRSCVVHGRYRFLRVAKGQEPQALRSVDEMYIERSRRAVASKSKGIPVVKVRGGGA